MIDDQTQSERPRYPLNAPGDFYSECDVCLACAVPQDEAPELMGWDETRSTCHFVRQPANPEELEHAINAVASACLESIRYAGSDPQILQRLIDQGARASCDVLAPLNVPSVEPLERE